MFEDQAKFLKEPFKRFISGKGISMNSPIQNDYEALQPGNLYSNHYYNLTIDFPDHWQSDRGASEYSVFRAFQADSGLTLYLNVMPLNVSDSGDPVENPNSMEFLNSGHNGDYKRSLVALLQTQSGIKAENIQLKETKLGVLDFVVTTYRNKQFFQDQAYYMNTGLFQTTKYNTTYTVGYSAPEELYDERVALGVLNKFKVLDPSSGKSRK